MPHMERSSLFSSSNSLPAQAQGTTGEGVLNSATTPMCARFPNFLHLPGPGEWCVCVGGGGVYKLGRWHSFLPDKRE